MREIDIVPSARFAGASHYRKDKVTEVTGLSISYIYDLISKEQFPPQIKIGPRAAAWLSTEIEIWMEIKRAKSRLIESSFTEWSEATIEQLERIGIQILPWIPNCMNESLEEVA